MRQIMLAIAAAIPLWAGGQDASGRVIYVDANSWGGSGSSWEDAYYSIQDALDDSSHGDEIWVTEGTYYENLNVSMAVKMYGGFSGIETSVEQRMKGEPRTIIDADVDSDPESADGNCLTSANPAVTVLDGFKFINGTGTDAFPANDDENNGGGVFLRGFLGSIVNCVFEDNSTPGRGGGLHLESSFNEDGAGTITLEDVVFRNNNAGHGGGLYLESQENFGSLPIQFTRVTFESNSAGEGGGLFADTMQWSGYRPDQNGDPAGAVLTIHDSTFEGNSASTGGGAYLVGGNYTDEPMWWPDVNIQYSAFSLNSAGHGGAVYARVDTDILWTTFTENEANGSESSAAGGALYLSDYNLIQAYGLTFTENTSAGPGGAVALNDSGQFFTNVTTFEGNTAARGGAVYVGRDSSADVWRSAFTGNQASQRGGGIFAERAYSLDVESSLFTGNSAGAGGGAVGLQDAPISNASGRPAWLMNTTISANHAPAGAALDVAGRSVARLTNNIIAFNDSGVRAGSDAAVAFSHNDVYGNGTDFAGIANPAGQNGNVSVDPGFANRAADDYHLAPASPLVDQGDAGEFYYWSQDLGNTPRVQGANVDLGAYERPGAAYTFLRFDGYLENQAATGALAGPVKVSVLNASGAVLTSYNGPVTISLRPDDGTLGATLGGTLTVNAVNGVATFTDLTIDKPGVGYVLTASLSDQGGRNSNAFAITQPVVRVSTSGNDRADGMTWATAKRTVQAGLDGATAGGAVHLAGGTYYGPFMTRTGGILGGFAGTGSTPDARDPAANKTILDGDGISSVLNVQYLSAPVAFDGLTIQNGVDSGVLNFADGVTISNNVITGNTSRSSGGGILTFGESTRITRNLIAHNSAGYRGGGISISAGSVTVDNNVMDANEAGYGSGVDTYTSSGVTLVNNTIVNGEGANGAVWLERGDATLANNIVFGNGSGVYASADRPPTATLIKNIVFGNSGPAYKDVEPGPGDIQADPLFQGGAGSAYIPGPGSPALNAGSGASVVGTLDFLGNPRIQGGAVDIGAIEVGVGPAMPSVVRALQIAGGLAAADSGDMDTLDVATAGVSQNRIDLLDALTLMRQVAGTP